MSKFDRCRKQKRSHTSQVTNNGRMLSFVHSFYRMNFLFAFIKRKSIFSFFSFLSSRELYISIFLAHTYERTLHLRYTPHTHTQTHCEQIKANSCEFRSLHSALHVQLFSFLFSFAHVCVLVGCCSSASSNRLASH